MMTGLPLVRALNRLRSSGMAHGNVLPLPMPRLESRAAINVMEGVVMKTLHAWTGTVGGGSQGLFEPKLAKGDDDAVQSSHRVQGLQTQVEHATVG